MQATRIQEVIDFLDEIMQEAAKRNSPLGYFPALYRKVTIEIQNRINCQDFEDCGRMERLDVAFANRYFEAYSNYHKGKNITQSWEVAFEAAKDPNLTLFQHLFLGINAHICLDLGVASAQLLPGKQIWALKNDFDKVSDVLASMTDFVQEDVANVWKPMIIIDFLGGKYDEKFADWVIHSARKEAWQVATSFHNVNTEAHDAIIEKVDSNAAETARKLWKPNVYTQILAKAVRLTEKGSPAQIIQELR
jgi:hypothetical protein